MTPADKRVMELLDRWLASIELHMKYAEFDDVTYQQMQPWPKHERPARWILELAQQKVLSLQTLCKVHLPDNDPSFAESLELMCFLANLVGAQHIQRFIPLALPDRETKPDTGVHQTIAAQPQPAPKMVSNPPPIPVPVVTSAQVIKATPKPTPVAVNTHPQQPAAIALPVATAPIARALATPAPVQLRPPVVDDQDKTREMPRLRPPPRQRQHMNKAAEPARVQVKNSPAAAKSQAVKDDVRLNDVVIADAVRLLRWGRQWHEIAELIARMAERPSVAEVRKILRSHKPVIEQQLEA